MYKTLAMMISVLVLGHAVEAGGKTAGIVWQSGLVTAASVSGQGPASAAPARAAAGRDIWWNYCIAANGIHYSVTSRMAPAKLSLAPNSPVRFREKGNRLYMLDRSGKRVELRVVRKGNAGSCP